MKLMLQKSVYRSLLVQNLDFIQQLLFFVQNYFTNIIGFATVISEIFYSVPFDSGVIQVVTAILGPFLPRYTIW